jgi:aspartyl-tRNA(Asn)/glutamyl-tRNA(Gln) amidotransferase subunit C
MLDKKEIKHIAALARIGVSEKEIEKYRHDISGVVEYFKELEKLDTKDVEPIGHITGRNNIFRHDEAENITEEDKGAILKNAPETKDGYVKVKSVL